jgi:hypothetical protein
VSVAYGFDEFAGREKIMVFAAFSPSQGPQNPSPNLADFEGVSQSGAMEVSFARPHDLSLGLQAAKRS